MGLARSRSLHAHFDGACVLGAQVKAKKAAAMRDINSRRGDLTPSQLVHEHERL